MRTRSLDRAGALAALPLVAACGLSPTMERAAAPVESPCSRQGLPRAYDAPPDTLAIRWYRAADDRDVESSARWCATVGEPVVELTPHVEFRGWSADVDLQVTTWNTKVGAGSLFDFLEGELGLDCRDGVGGGASDAGPFVVLLQETWRYSEDLPRVEGGSLVHRTVDDDRSDEADVVEIAERCGLALVYVPSARNGPDTGPRPHEDRGNAILSSLPITTPIAFDLPFESARKVAVAATVYAPGGERVRVVSVHLDVASTLVRTLISGNQTRARQASGLIDGLEKAERDGPLTVVTVVGGDFNTWAGNESALKLMREAFPDSPRWDDLSTWRPLPLPLDHIFFRRGAFSHMGVDGYRRIENHYGSDHFGRRLVVEHEPAPTGR